MISDGHEELPEVRAQVGIQGNRDGPMKGSNKTERAASSYDLKAKMLLKMLSILCLKSHLKDKQVQLAILPK